MSRADSVFRFGPYEVHPNSQELLKHGTRVKLRGQPFLVLEVLLEHAGEVVTRDEIRQRLWASNTFVDFEHGLNTSIKRVRQILCDSAVEPCYIETLPRIGYRFIAPVEVSAPKNGMTLDREAAGNGQQGIESGERKTEVAAPQASEHITEPKPELTVSGSTTPHAIADRMLAPRNWRAALAALAVVMAVVLAVKVGSSLNLGSRWKELFTSARTYHSIAVLPLQSLSTDPNQEYFADGITDEIITNFAQAGDLRVISRTSAMRYKGSGKSAPQIGKELGVDALVEGTVERVGTRVRVRIQLIDAARDRHLWANIYDRELSDVLILESSVAHDIVEEARGEMEQRGALQKATAPGVVKPQAYEAYLQGRYFWNKRSSDALSKSIDFFQEAVALDPKLAVAYAGLADSYSILGSDVLPVAVAQGKARAAATKAIALDPSLAESHAAMAMVAFYYDWDWKKADGEFQTALRLNPNYATAHQWYSYYLSAMERFPEAMIEAQRARELDPLSLSINTTLANEYLSNQQYDQAAAIDQRVLEIDPNFVPAHRSMAKIYEGKQMWPEAIEELKKTVDLSQDSARALSDLAYGLALAGKQTEALRIVKSLEELSATRYVSPFEIAKVFVALHDYDSAIRNLETSYRTRESQVPFLNITIALYPLHSNPRFHDLVRKVGLPAG